MPKKTRFNDVPASNLAGSSDVPQPAETVQSEPLNTEQESAATQTENVNPNPEPSGQLAVSHEEHNQNNTNGLEDAASGGKGAASTSAKPISEEKVTTNPENSKKSTGPTTPEGKAVSARNSAKHGIFSRNVIRPGEHAEEDRASFEAILDSLVAHYSPADSFEELLVEKAASEFVRSSRVLSFEQSKLNDPQVFLGQSIERILRYHVAVNRQLFQALDLLDRLKAAREGKNGSGSKGGKE
jgi:hypothetical protein